MFESFGNDLLIVVLWIATYLAGFFHGYDKREKEEME